MANQQLIKGARAAAPLNAGLADYYLRSKEKQYGRGGYRGGYPSRSQMNRFLNKKVTDHIDGLPPGYAVEKLPASMQGQVTELFRRQYQDAGNYMRLKNKAPAGSAQWIDADSKFQSIKSQWTTMSGQLDNFQALKTEYLKDYDSRTISEGSDTDALKLLMSTDNYTFGTENGNIAFHLEDGSIIKGGDLPTYFNKNSAGASKLLELNQKAYNNGGEWDGSTRDLYKRQVKLIARENGREGLLSLATDDFLDEPLIDRDGPNAWLLEPEYHDELEDFVIDNWVSGIETASNSGYQKKKRKSTVTTGGGGGSKGPLASQEATDRYWNSGNLNNITNEPGWNKHYEVVEGDEKGTYHVTYNSDPDNPYNHKPPRVIKKNIDPSNPDHKAWWDDAMRGGGANMADASKV
jgi:hypothetical protein